MKCPIRGTADFEFEKTEDQESPLPGKFFYQDADCLKGECAWWVMLTVPGYGRTGVCAMAVNALMQAGFKDVLSRGPAKKELN